MKKEFFIEWAKIGLWTHQEAAILMLDGDPHDEQSSYYYNNVNDDYPLLEKRIERAIILKNLHGSSSSVLPRDVIEWASKEKIKLPEGLYEAVMENTTPKAAPKASTFKIQPKEENSLLKIVSAIAYSTFYYDPKTSEASKVIKKMARAIADSGLQITDETAEKWIKLAVGKYPPNRNS